jgi:hypothetical protein
MSLFQKNYDYQHLCRHRKLVVIVLEISSKLHFLWSSSEKHIK